jgi:hypothetical protein
LKKAANSESFGRYRSPRRDGQLTIVNASLAGAETPVALLAVTMSV